MKKQAATSLMLIVVAVLVLTACVPVLPPAAPVTQNPASALAATIQPLTAEVPSEKATTTPAIIATEVITFAPGPPSGEPQEGKCWTGSIAVWREDAWRCDVGNAIYDPCFSTDEGVVCGANPNAATDSFLLLLTEPLPAPEVPQDTTGHAWQVELADGTVCEYATGATGGVGDERINYFCPSPDPGQAVVILGNLLEGSVWLARRAVLTGDMPNLIVLESAEVPIRTVWR